MEARDDGLRSARQCDVDEADDRIEEYREAGARCREIARPHQLRARDGRHQRRLLQDREPEVGEARQAETKQLGQQDEAQRRPAANSKGARRVERGAVQSPEDAQEDFAGICGEDQVEGGHPGEKTAELGPGREPEGARRQVEQALTAEVDEEQAQKFRDAAKDAGKCGGWFVEQGISRVDGKGEEQAAREAQWQSTAREHERRAQAAGEFVTPSASAANCRARMASHKGARIRRRPRSISEKGKYLSLMAL